VNAKRGSEGQAKRGGDRAKRPLETRTPGPKDMIREVRRQEEGAAHRECGSSSLRVRWWGMLTIKSHGVEFSIAGCVREMVCAPNPLSRGCHYMGVLPSTLPLGDSYPCVTRLMTQSESECEIHQLTRSSQLRPNLQPITTHKSSHVP